MAKLLFREKIWLRTRKLTKHFWRRKIAKIPRYDFETGLKEVQRRIRGLENIYPVVLVAICGESGTGKTHFAKLVGKQLLMDDYYTLEKHVSEYDRDRPRGIDLNLLRKHLIELKKKHPIQKPIYAHANVKRVGYEKFEPTRVIALDGLWSFHKKIADLCHLKVYIDLPRERLREIVIARDQKERGRTKEYTEIQLRERVEPLADIYVIPNKRKADIIIER